VDACGIDSLSRLPRRQVALSSTSQLGLVCDVLLTGCVAGLVCRFGFDFFCFGSFGMATGASFGVSHASSALPLK
jgi:hypothetical protein